MTTATNLLDFTYLSRLYAGYPLKSLSYGTVRDYCDSFDHLPALAAASGDLKDCQRPWVLKALLAKYRRPARLLEIGAGQPLVANLLHQFGHDVWIVDPYDGSGKGPVTFEEYRDGHPNLKFVRSEFSETLTGVEDHSFDGIYSISVLEHIPGFALQTVFRGLQRFLKLDGTTIHAIDHVYRGKGAAWHLENLRRMAHGFGFLQSDLDNLLMEMMQDTDTYYLSAESHNRWRGRLSYDEFPMRVCVSIQVVADAHRLNSIG
jgi:predicted TPR repeat methyltransferase